jgi:hypothetical protein
MVPRMLGLATKVVSDYGKVLSTVEPGVYGLPESLLPHTRETIRLAILTLLNLAQFVADEEADLVSRGQASVAGGGSGSDDASAEPAMRIINRIKLDMERALEEMRHYI